MRLEEHAAGGRLGASAGRVVVRFEEANPQQEANTARAPATRSRLQEEWGPTAGATAGKASVRLEELIAQGLASRA